MMSILITDATQLRGTQPRNDKAYVVSTEVLYADDSMVMGCAAEDVQRAFDSIIHVGKQYGLEINMSKTILLRINGDCDIFGPDGQPVQTKHSATYLGSLLSIDGRPSTELSRRLGEAGKVFEKLFLVWKHASLSRKRKLEVFEACVLSKLLYSLESLWLLKAERDRLDSFYVRCLRRIYGIKAAFMSRVSNHVVLETAARVPLSQTLLYNQLLLFGHIARLNSTSSVRRVVFLPECYDVQNWHVQRKVGRPRLQWTRCVHAHAILAAGTQEGMENEIRCQQTWKAAVAKYCFGDRAR